MLLSLCAESAVAAIMKGVQKKAKYTKFGSRIAKKIEHLLVQTNHSPVTRTKEKRKCFNLLKFP